MKRFVENKVKKVLANIILLRSERKLSQQDVASQLGVTQNAYSKLETGPTKIRLNDLCRLADVFDVEISEIVGNV